MAVRDEVVIVGGARSAVGDFGGALKDVPATKLAALVTGEALCRSGVAPGDVEHAVFGNVIHGEARDMYLSRVAAVEAGIPNSAPALTLNRLCGSGAQAVISAAQMIALGECKVAVAGGAESMSRAGHLVPALRFGQRMGDTRALDMMVGALNDPFGHGHMGITAENVSERYQISREDQDAFALESHRRAAAAIAEGRFKSQIVPIEIKGKGGQRLFDTDEHVRADATLADFTRLRPVFKPEGVVTAGNASGVNDGAGAVVLMAGAEAERRGLAPMARILSWSHAGVDPEIMGIGPIKAVPVALERAGLSVDDLDVIESNEAFAAQALAVTRRLGFDPAKVNPNGGAVAIGHPIGATGAMLVVKAIHELARTGGRHALVTMCIGGGQGIAIVLERP